MEKDKSNFLDQKPRVATEKDCKLRWDGAASGERFRCYLCGHRFIVGDVWRIVHATHKGCINFLVCQDCDGEDVLDRWIKQYKEARKRYWWLVYD